MDLRLGFTGLCGVEGVWAERVEREGCVCLRVCVRVGGGQVTWCRT